MTQHHEATARAEAAPDVDRRRFLQAGLAGTGAMVAAVTDAQLCALRRPPAMTSTGADQIPRKPLGRTGEQRLDHRTRRTTTSELFAPSMMPCA